MNLYSARPEKGEREREREKGGGSKARKEKLYNESESTPKTEREGGQCLHRCNNLF